MANKDKINSSTHFIFIKKSRSTTSREQNEPNIYLVLGIVGVA